MQWRRIWSEDANIEKWNCPCEAVLCLALPCLALPSLPCLACSCSFHFIHFGIEAINGAAITNSVAID
jgi:hypothetical protein